MASHLIDGEPLQRHIRRALLPIDSIERLCRLRGITATRLEIEHTILDAQERERRRFTLIHNENSHGMSSPGSGKTFYSGSFQLRHAIHQVLGNHDVCAGR